MSAIGGINGAKVVTQPISGWLHCGVLQDETGLYTKESHPADLRLAPLRSPFFQLREDYHRVTQPISGWLHCGISSPVPR